MSDFFDSARFGRLFRAHLAENRREYLGFLIVACLVDLIFILIAFYLIPNRSYIAFQFHGQATWCLTGLIITGIIF